MYVSCENYATALFIPKNIPVIGQRGFAAKFQIRDPGNN